jgi:ankyrin repeat protein
MSQTEERENEEGESECELDAAVQQPADEELLQACSESSVAEVKAAQRKGANWNATDDGGRSGLMFTCMREPGGAVVPIVRLLLRKKCPVSQCDGSGWNALHFACECSTAEVVRLLLQADKKAAGRLTDDGSTCLMKCAGNGNSEEAVKIATLLLGCGCPVNATDSRGRTALMDAALLGCMQMVSLLIARGADVSARDEDHWTALHFACVNGAFGREVMPVLCAAGADVTAEDKAGYTCFDVALMRSKAMADAMVPFLPAGFSQSRLLSSEADPVGSLTCATEHGASVSDNDFAVGVFDGEWSHAVLWADLRNGLPILLDDSDNDAFRALLESKDAKLWKWASSELPHQHPTTGDTVFHVLCRSEALNVSDKLAVLADLRLHYRNPLTPNYRNELCVQLAKEPELKKALQEYACWQPYWQAMEWFGPLFQKRAFALLLVCYRLKAKHPKLLAGLNRDIRHLLVKYASGVEYIYVPSKQ